MYLMRLILVSVIFGASMVSMAQEPSNKEVASQILEKLDAGVEHIQLVEQLFKVLHEEVVTEIETEAQASSMDRDSYIEDAVSYIAFLDHVKSYDLESMDRADLFILILKSGIRFDIQSQIRFLPEGHWDRENELMTIMESVNEKIGL